MSRWAAVGTGQAGKEAPTGRDAPQPRPEGYWGTSGMVVMSRALASGDFLPTVIPEQPGVKDGISREAGSWKSCGSFVGAMLGPGGLFIGAKLSPGRGRFSG